VVAGDDEQRSPERTEELGCPLMLFRAVSMGEIAARHDELRLDLVDERPKVCLDLRLLSRPDVEIRYLNDA
jgi:hypothetical protein